MSFQKYSTGAPTPVSAAYYHDFGKGRRGDPSLVTSRSQLMDFAACPSRWIMGHEEEQTPEMEYGTLIDCLVTAPASFDDRFAVYPATYTAIVKKEPVEKPWNLNAEVCAEWKAARESEGKQCVKPKHMEIARAAVARLMGYRPIADLLEDSERQVMAIADWHDSGTGLVVPVKILIDLLPGHPVDTLADFKTAKDASHDAMARACMKHHYCEQAALYLDVYNVAADEERELWQLAVQESEPPFEPVLWMLDESFIRMGRANYQDALRKYCECLADNSWPTYSMDARRINGVGVLEPLQFMLKDLL